MIVSFQASKPYPDLNCGICRESLNQDVVIHEDNDGEKHPLHKKCALEWLKTSATCPFCRVNIDPSSLFSWKDKVVNCWNKYNNFNNSRANIIAGIVTGIIFGLLLSIERLDSGEIVFKVKLIRLGLITIPAVVAGITAASLARIENMEAAFCAATLTTYMLY
jgi:hypothetical protein